ncbi:MAG: nucleotidyltransferase domain-containing protein, partial [Acidimicrobiaceae bacterium]|nr:nucleotidyltransferase domain-containing protein [Acidimicrobiaceae bacterium]
MPPAIRTSCPSCVDLLGPARRHQPPSSATGEAPLDPSDGSGRRPACSVCLERGSRGLPPARPFPRAKQARCQDRVVLPALVEAAVGRYLRLADLWLPGRVTGWYLVGSLALDAFRPGRSDVDFVAVLDRE